jgi:hypothetical protein
LKKIQSLKRSIFEKEIDPNTIDFGAKGVAEQDEFTRIIKQ